MTGMTLRRRGKCEWVTYSERFRGLRRRLPTPLRYRLWRKWKWATWKTHRCGQAATHIATCDHFEGYNNLPVCAKHLKDVEMANALDDAIKSGEFNQQGET